MLLAALAERGFETLDLGLCADRADAFSDCIERALSRQAHVLLVSGGAALGDADVVRQSGVRFMPLNLRPGRGIAWSHVERGGRTMALLGLPGNAVAAFVMFVLVALPVLRRCAGSTPAHAARFRLPLATPVAHRAGRIDWMRARFVDVAGELGVAPLLQQGSAMLRTLTDADALIAIGPDANYAVGDRVDTIPLRSS
jgi:molybdopterin molybdotransferase